MTATGTVEGMTCGHGERTVEAALRGVSGTTDPTADRQNEQARVDGDADVTVLVQAVEEAEYIANV